jgi:DNA invertase Pin-like site-specific DNA recombinase
MKAIIYTRYSPGGRQTDQSTEGQLRDCYAFCEQNEYMVVGEYNDRHITGRTDDRPEFRRMIADAQKRQFDIVIVWKLDRFARNRYDSAFYKARLKKYGVKVVSAKEFISDAPEGIILESILEGMAEYYSANLSQNVKRGIRETAMKGGFIGGTCPIGYKAVDGKVVIDEDKAPAIVYAFEQYAAGVRKKEIMAALTARGIRGAKGGPLRFTSFQHALKNPKYTGEYTISNGIVMTNYPALVSKELFAKVQERLKERAHAPAVAKARTEYLLQGKAYCGMCGTRMVGECGTGKSGNKFYYYACGRKKKLHTCTKINEKKDFLEWYVTEQTVEYVLTPTRIETIASAVVAEYDKEFNDDNIKTLERRIYKLDMDIDSAVDLMIQNTNKDVRARTEKRVAELAAQKEDLEIDLSKLQLAAGIRYTTEDIKLWLRQFCKGDLMDEKFRRRIIDVFINSVYLYDDKVAIFYNIRDGKQISYMDVAEALDGEPEGFGEAFDKDGGGVRISSPMPRQLVH